MTNCLAEACRHGDRLSLRGVGKSVRLSPMNVRRAACLRLIVAAALIVSACATPSARSASVPAVQGPSREVLPNGMRLIIQEHRVSDVVALHLWVGVGGRDELPAERGFSHFAEHMLFKGTPSRGPGFVDREIEAVGGPHQRGDLLGLHLLLHPAPRRRAPHMASRFSPTWRSTPSSIRGSSAREREVVYEEMRLGEDNLRSFLGRRLFNLTFRGESYGQPVLGDRDMLGGRQPGDAARLLQAPLRARQHDPGRGRSRPAQRDPRRGNPSLRRPAGPGVSARDPPPRRTPSTTLTARCARARSGRPPSAWAGSPRRSASPDMFAADLLAHILGGSQTSPPEPVAPGAAAPRNFRPGLLYRAPGRGHARRERTLRARRSREGRSPPSSAR